MRCFIRSFGIVQSASLQLISLHVALGSSLYRCRAGDVMRVPRNKAPWAWVRDGQSCSVIECHAPALPGHGEAASRPSRRWRLFAFFTRPAGLIGHPYWTMTGAERFMNRINFYKNASLMGGFFLLYVTGAGKYSIDARLGLSGAPPRRTQAP